MISKWKVSNFKSIRDETELELKPLTIFAGANSSGKSTFIQSILLVAQTLAHKAESRPVILNGNLTRLGQFDDLKFNGSKSKQITIKCTCQPLLGQETATQQSFQDEVHNLAFLSELHDDIDYRRDFSKIQEVTCEISFDADTSSYQRDLFQIQPRLFSARLSYVPRNNGGYPEQKANAYIRYSSENISKIKEDYGISEINDDLRASLAYPVKLDPKSMEEVKKEFVSAKPIGCMLKHFFPERIVCIIDIIKERAASFTKAIQGDLISGLRLVQYETKYNTKPLSKKIFMILSEILKKNNINLDQVFPNLETFTFRTWHEQLHKSEKCRKIESVLRAYDTDDLLKRIYEVYLETSTKKEFILRDLLPSNSIIKAVQYLNKSFTSSLKYLGPLRDAPKGVYPLAPVIDLYDVGSHGEHLAFIFELHKNSKIHYIPSANFKNFKDQVIDRKMITQTLKEAVIDWLEYLGVAKSVKSQDRGKFGHGLKVRLSNSDNDYDLTHIGVGVSQVLPILVMCLLANTDSTLIFEQPELHLHPKVQTLLGDFFLSMALSHKQCIVETHSEYLIDRLRLRIAMASPESELNRYAKIYFVEKPSQVSSFREVKINEYGAISEWPEGFFDQSSEEAEKIMRAASKKRKANREKNNGQSS